MLVSTRGRYAIRIVLELSSHPEDTRVSLSDLSERQEISLKYAESIVATLVKAGILDGQRGKSGGYRLCRKPESITIGEILKLTEESLAPVACLDCKPNNCERAATCKTLPLWQNLNSLIENYLGSVTIADLRNGTVKSVQ